MLDPTKRSSIHAPKASEGSDIQRLVTKSRSIQNVSGGIPKCVANARRKIKLASGKPPSSRVRIDIPCDICSTAPSYRGDQLAGGQQDISTSQGQ
jgi:hypothetical protein